MFDEFLNVASAFDWITPTIAFVQDFFYGPASDFGIPSNGGWSGKDIKRVFKRHGIRVWGLMLNLNGDMLMFTVPRNQAKWAYYVLQNEGVPILFAPTEIVNSSPGRKGKLPKGKSSNPDFLESFQKLIDKLDDLI
jgi:hypothetical protein